jgi:hypothetical protein
MHRRWGEVLREVRTAHSTPHLVLVLSRHLDLEYLNSRPLRQGEQCLAS